jgi:hypothetical protein
MSFSFCGIRFSARLNLHSFNCHKTLINRPTKCELKLEERFKMKVHGSSQYLCCQTLVLEHNSITNIPCLAGHTRSDSPTSAENKHRTKSSIFVWSTCITTATTQLANAENSVNTIQPMKSLLTLSSRNLKKGYEEIQFLATPRGIWRPQNTLRASIHSIYLTYLLTPWL